MKIITNTPGTFVAGHRRLGWLVLFAIPGLGFVWAILALLPGGHPFPLYLPLIFFGAVCLFLAFGSPLREQIVFDRAVGKVHIRRKQINGYTNHTFDLENVDRVAFSLPRNTRAVTPQTAPAYMLDLVVSDGMDAGTYRIFVNKIHRHKAIALRTAMNDWLAP